MRQYRAFFSQQNWRALDARIMKEHKTINCLKCPTIPDFKLKKLKMQQLKIHGCSTSGRDAIVAGNII